MTRTRMLRIVCWSLIILFPLSELIIGYDSSDIGFILNQYEFVFTDCDTVYLPLLFTDICGNLFLRIFRLFSMPEYLAFEVLWALCVYYLCFMSERLYRKYYDNELILPALVVAVIFAKTNLNFFMYNTTVAVFSLTSLYFFVVGVNEKRNTYLGISVIFLCFSVLSKISAAIQIVMYAVLFYDFYIRKDKKLFVRQLFSCLAGGIIGLALCAAVIASSCGIDKYLTMFGDMFLYAGNSADGHTMGNMLLINIKGVMHGFVWLVPAVGAILLFRIKPLERFSMAIGRVISVLACVYSIGGILNACGMAVIPAVYRLTWRFFETTAVVTALMYVCAVVIAVDKTYSYNYKRLVIASVVMTCCMPIGSNVGITHICNESFFAMPMIFMLVRDKLFDGGKPWKKNISTYIVAAFAVCMLAISVTQAFYRSTPTKNNAYTSTNTEIAQLKYIRSDRTESEALEELLTFIADGEYDSAVAVGSIPIVNYLAKIKPGVDSCGGWIETDYVTTENILRDLHKNMPLIIVCNSEFSDDTAKNRAVEEFIEEQNYVETFSNWKFTVYDRDDR